MPLPDGLQPEPTANDTITKWTPLVHKLTRRYRIPDLEYDDQIALGLSVVWQAHEKFDPSRGVKFMTFVFNQLQYRFRASRGDFARNKKRQNNFKVRQFSTLDNDLTDLRFSVLLPDPTDNGNFDDISVLLNYLTQRERFIAGKLFEGHTQREISKIIGVSHQAIHEALKTLRRKLRKSNLIECPNCGKRPGKPCDRKRRGNHPERDLVLALVA